MAIMLKQILRANAAMVILVVVGCGPSTDSVVSDVFAGRNAEWIDLSYAFDSATIFWPTAKPFDLEVVTAGMTEAGFYYEANNFSLAEHGGTHLDAPIHFAEARHTTDLIPIDRLVGPAVVIDVTSEAASNPDYRLTVQDLETWEGTHGSIPDGAIVLVHTGWGARWPDRARYLGTSLEGPAAVPELHFPGVHPDAAQWRNIRILSLFVLPEAIAILGVFAWWRRRRAPGR